LRIIKRKTHAKVLALVDNIIPHEKRIGDQALSRYFTSACDGFMVMSRSVGEEIKVFSDAPVKFTPHPIYDIYGEKIERSAAISFLKLNENTRYLLFFGLIRKYKGLDLLIEALGILKQRDFFKKYDIKLLVAGEFYEEESAYRNLIKTLNVENQVIIRANFIPNDEVKYYFEASDLIVQPYRTATQSGISQIAYHFEKPMLVTNVGGLPEIVANGKAGYVVEPTPQLIADAIEDFYMHDRAKAFIPHVISHKKNFTWEAMVEGFLSLSQSNV
jgi:glycosyltransferase involved in cell wall biosynthesis